MYIGIIVFRLFKHNDELDIKTLTLLGGHNTFTGGGGTAPCATPPSRWLRPWVPT